MNVSQSDVNRDEFCQLSAPQFRQQLLVWMQTDSVSQRLQAKMRTDLITAFNETTLGNQLNATVRQPTIQAVHTPQLLALHTLISEFLYTLNCQFTLSVLASETPHAQTMPNFAERTPFRFGQSHVEQLLAAMGLLSSTVHAQNIVTSYTTTTTTDNSDGKPMVNNSLLFIMCQALRQQTQTNPSSCTTQSTNNNRHRRRPRNTADDGKKSHSRNSTKSKWSLTAYIQVLTAQVLQLADTVTHWCPDDTEAPMDASDHRLLLSKLRIFSGTYPKLPRKLSRLTQAVRMLNGMLERTMQTRQKKDAGQRSCQQHMQVPLIDTTATKDADYNSWVLQLRHSTNGRRFLRNLRSHHRQRWDRELEQQRTNWELKFQQERRLLKMQYKKRLLKKMGALLAVSSGIDNRVGNAFTMSVEKYDGARDYAECDGVMSEVAECTQKNNERSRTKRPTYDRLSNRKLPDIHIAPCNRGPKTNIALTSTFIDETVCRRLQQLNLASENIEKSVEQWLQQYTADQLRLAARQRRIQHQSLVVQDLNASGHPPKITPGTLKSMVD